MSRENPASAEAVPGVAAADCEPNVEKRPTAKASAAIRTSATAGTSHRRAAPVDVSSGTPRLLLTRRFERAGAGRARLGSVRAVPVRRDELLDALVVGGV